MTVPSAFRANRAIGAMFFSLLGGAWLALWAVQAFGVRPEGVVLLAIATAVLLYLALRTFQQNKSALAEEANSPSKQRADRIFNLVNAGQWVLIFIVGNVLKNLGHSDWVLAAVMFIVGAHFIPLAYVFKYLPHYLLGTLLMLWAIGYPFLSRAGPSNPVGCLGTGLLLWGSALYALAAKPAADSKPFGP